MAGRYANPFQFDMALQRPVFYMTRRGIKVDQEKKIQLGEVAHEDWEKWQKLLDEVVTGHLNVNSDKQVHGFLYHDKDGLRLPPRTKDKKVTADEDALRAIMADAENKTKIAKTSGSHEKWFRVFLVCKLMLKIREVRKAISSYLGCPPGCTCKKPSSIDFDFDGRMRCTTSVGGTETMRFAHSKSLVDTGINMATVPHKFRVMFIADEGYELAEFDLNRGESWVYAYLSMDPELVRIHSGGLDFHAETAAAIQSAFGGKGLSADEIRRLAKTGDQFGYRIRYLGKKVNHASAYRMGPFRAAEVVNEESDDTNITVVPAQMKLAQALWKQKYFGIQSWWDDIDHQLENGRKLITPYGRVREFFGFMDDHLKKEATASVPQSTSVDYLNQGMLRVYDEIVKPGHFQVELLHQNHDSILIQYPRKFRDDVHPLVKECLTSTVRISGHDISIPVEGGAGQNWGDWHATKNPDGIKEVA